MKACPDPLVITVVEAAALLGISRNTAYSLIANDQLPHLRLGRRIVIPRHALERLLETALASSASGPVGSMDALRGSGSEDDRPAGRTRPTLDEEGGRIPAWKDSGRCNAVPIRNNDLYESGIGVARGN
jgi:excisionase family DNA binding protein